MNRQLAAATMVLALAISAGRAVAEDIYTIDPVHSQPIFEVRHMGFSLQRGSFGKATGKVTLDRAAKKGSVEVTIDTASIKTIDPRLDTHVKSEDFFNVAKYPTMTFKSKKIEAAGPGKYNVVGDLTLHGVTKEVTLGVEATGAPIKDPWGNMRAGATATTTINRKDFGLTWNKMIEAGGAVVGDAVAVEIDVEAVKKK